MQLMIEMRKLIRPATLYIVVGGIAIIFVLVGFFESAAARQWNIAVAGYDQMAHPTSEKALCHFLAVPVGPRCDSKVEEEIGFANEFKEEVINEFYPLSAATQDPLGSGGIAAGLIASFPGMCLVGALAAAHLGSEWELGTAGVVLARQPHRWRFMLVKLASVWISAILLALICWAALAAAGPLLRSLYEVPPAPAGFEMGSYAIDQLVRASLVLAAVSAVATAIGMAVRNALGIFGTTLAFLLIGVVASGVRPIVNFSLGFWVTSWMHFDPLSSWVDHVWPDQFPLGNPDASLALNPGVGAFGLVGTFLVATAAGMIWVHRTDVRM